MSLPRSRWFRFLTHSTVRNFTSSVPHRASPASKISCSQRHYKESWHICQVNNLNHKLKSITLASFTAWASSTLSLSSRPACNIKKETKKSVPPSLFKWKECFISTFTVKKSTKCLCFLCHIWRTFMSLNFYKQNRSSSFCVDQLTYNCRNTKSLPAKREEQRDLDTIIEACFLINLRQMN